MLLCHFTCLFYLPDILREGLSKGEVPISPHDIRQAPNFTTNPSFASLDRTTGLSKAVVDKSRVRLTVSIPDADKRLESWKAVCRRLRVSKDFQRDLDRTGQGKFWYVYWGVVPVGWFQTVEVRDGDSYVPYDSGRLAELVRAIEQEREGITPNGDFIVVPRHRQGSWLLDGAERPGAT